MRITSLWLQLSPRKEVRDLFSTDAVNLPLQFFKKSKVADLRETRSLRRMSRIGNANLRLQTSIYSST